MTLWRARPNAVAIFVVACAVCAIAPASRSWLDLAVLTGVTALIALSVGLSYGQGGILSMAQGSFAAIGAYATAVASTRLGLSPWLGLLMAMALPALVAWLVGRMVTRLPPLATALATLAVGTIVSIVARSWDAVTGGFVGVTGIPPIPGFRQPELFNVLVWSFVCAAVLLYENLVHSAHGRALRAARHDRARAIADGVNVPSLLSVTLALSAAMAGAAGWLYAHYISYMSPESLDNATSISALLMAVVGGVGYVMGPILGTVILMVLGHLLPAQEAQGLFYGGCLVVILLVAREGVLGIAAKYRTGRTARARAEEPAPLAKPPAPGAGRPDIVP